MMDNIITIYIPVTRVDFLEKTFSCIIRQTSSNYNVLVLDNTGDATHDVLNTFNHFFCKKNAMFIKTDHKLGDGDPTKSWNYGLKYINTDYFTLLGDDDMLAENYVEEMLKLIHLHPSAPVYRSRVHMIDKDDKITRYGQKLPLEISWDEYIYERTTYKLVQSTSEFCIHTQILKQLDGYVSYPFAIKSDDATYVALMLHGNMISTNATCAYWRRHGKNLSMAVPCSVRISALKKYQQFVNALIDKYEHSLDKDLLLGAVKVDTLRIRLFTMKNQMYRWGLFRPFIKFMYKKRIIKSI